MLKRDTLKLALYGQENSLPGDWDALLAALLKLHKNMHRKLDIETLTDLERHMTAILSDIQSLLDINQYRRNERQYQNSKQIP